MVDVKISALPELGSGSLDAAADFLLVSDASAASSKRIKPAELIKGAWSTVSPFWDFTTGALSPSITFTRASAGWRYNSAGVLVSETTDVARFQYDPATLVPRGLLIEEARTEAHPYNCALDDASWVKSNISITADDAAAPDGTTTMDKVVQTNLSASNHVRKATTFYSYVAGTTYMFAVVAKAAGRDWIYLQPTGGFGTTRAYFNVTAGTVGTLTAGVTAYITPLGGGLFRCVMLVTATITAGGSLYLTSTTADNTPSPTGDGVNGLHAWAFALQAGDSVTSIIPTTTTTVTRAADVATITNGLSLVDQCWIVKARTPCKSGGGLTNTAFQVDDGTNNNRRTLHYRTDSTLHFIATSGGVTQCDIDLGAVAADTDFVVAVRWADNNFAASLSGGAIVTDLAGTNPVNLTTASIGRGAGANYWNSTIKTIETRRTATDAELPLLAA